MNLMIVHPAIQDELILGRPLEGEARRPVFVVTLRERDSSLRELDRGAIRSERIVHALKGHTRGRLCVSRLCVQRSAVPAGQIEDGAANGWSRTTTSPVALMQSPACTGDVKIPCL